MMRVSILLSLLLRFSVSSHSINVTSPFSICNQVEGIQSHLIRCLEGAGIEWRPWEEKVHSLLEEFLKAPEGLYNNLARPQIVLFTTSVITGGHKHCLFFFFKRKREVCSACWLIHITKSLENLLDQIKPIKVPWVGRKGNVCLSPVNLLIFKSIFSGLSSVWIVDTENLLVEKIYRILSDGWGEAVTDPDSHRRMSLS